MASRGGDSSSADEQRLVLEPKPGHLRPLSELLRGDSREVSKRVAELKAELESWIEHHPDDYSALVALGELNVRVGLTDAARRLLYRASLLKPPSWEAYQRTSLLLRRAEADQAHAVSRVPGAPPPLWMRQGASAVGGLAERMLAKLRHPADAPQ
jgi:hypothetical protein